MERRSRGGWDHGKVLGGTSSPYHPPYYSRSELLVANALNQNGRRARSLLVPVGEDWAGHPMLMSRPCPETPPKTVHARRHNLLVSGASCASVMTSTKHGSGPIPATIPMPASLWVLDFHKRSRELLESTDRPLQHLVPLLRGGSGHALSHLEDR